MGFVLQDRILQPFLQIFSPLSDGRIDTFWSRKRTKQPRPGTIRPPSESGKRHKPEGGTGEAGGRAETGSAGASNGRGRRAPGPKKSDAGGGRAGKGDVAGGKTLRGEDAEAGEKGDAGGRAGEGDVAGRGIGKAGTGKGKKPPYASGAEPRQGSSAPQGDTGSAI